MGGIQDKRFLRFSSNFFNVFSFKIGEGVNSELLVMLQICRTPVLQGRLLGMPARKRGDLWIAFIPHSTAQQSHVDSMFVSFPSQYKPRLYQPNMLLEIIWK